MIERKFVKQNLKKFQIRKFLFNRITRAGLSEVKLQRTPLGDKIVIEASRPGLVVGKGGSTIKKISAELKDNFELDNPQIEIEEVEDPRANANIIAEMIANSIERYGPSRFKGIGHRSLGGAMNAGALGIEIIMSGKIPGGRARRWRFYQGYLKKCGDIADTQVDEGFQEAYINTGSVGIKVRVMHSDTELPDKLEVLEKSEPVVEELPAEETDEEETSEDAEETQAEDVEAESKADVEDESEAEVVEDKAPEEDDAEAEAEDDSEAEAEAEEEPAEPEEAEAADVKKPSGAETVEDEVPTSDNLVREIKAWLDANDVEYKSRMRKAELLELVEEHSK